MQLLLRSRHSRRRNLESHSDFLINSKYWKLKMGQQLFLINCLSQFHWCERMMLLRTGNQATTILNSCSLLTFMNSRRSLASPVPGTCSGRGCVEADSWKRAGDWSITFQPCAFGSSKQRAYSKSQIAPHGLRPRECPCHLFWSDWKQHYPSSLPRTEAQPGIKIQGWTITQPCLSGSSAVVDLWQSGFELGSRRS